MPSERVLSKVLPGGKVALLGGDFTLSGGMAQWEQFTITAPGVSYSGLLRSTYFDLSGYTRDKETVFPQSVLLQNIGLTYLVTAAGNQVNHASLVTTDPVRTSDLSVDAGDRIVYPGASSSTYNLEQIISARVEGWEQLSTTALGTLTQSNSWGSGDSTAGQKLHLTEIWLFDTNVDTHALIPDIAYVMPSIIDHEKFEEYAMRLKRSYELANQV